MKSISMHNLAPVLFIPHGGGPLPLLGDPGHQEMNEFLIEMAQRFNKPAAIIVISAHWEEEIPTITGSQLPPLIYDYYGFPDEAYDIEYPVKGDSALAHKLFSLLKENGISAKLDDQRGLDHGVFVPLKIMYPQADIPCVQLSLCRSLDPEFHIQIGKALAALRQDNVLVVGSGFSFHNLRSFFATNDQAANKSNIDFEDWLIHACTDREITEAQREKLLIEWESAPFARFCHPREEHLLPLHVCYGMAQSAASLVFQGKILGKKASAYLW